MTETLDIPTEQSIPARSLRDDLPSWMTSKAPEAPAVLTEAQRLTAEGYTHGINRRDGQTHRASDWHRLMKPEWSDPGDPGANLLADIADIRATGVPDYQLRFLDHLARVATRRLPDGSSLAMLTSKQAHRLRAIAFKAKQRESDKLLKRILSPPERPEIIEEEGHDRYIPWRDETFYSRPRSER
jgi:hypothetical protein